MSAIRFYTDEHVSRAVVAGLRRRGVGVTTVPEAEMLGASDPEQLAFAAERGWVIFTQDADFLRLAADGASHAGIVYAAQGTSTGEIIRGLLQLALSVEAEEMIGSLRFI